MPGVRSRQAVLPCFFGSLTKMGFLLRSIAQPPVPGQSFSFSLVLVAPNSSSDCAKLVFKGQDEQIVCHCLLPLTAGMLAEEDYMSLKGWICSSGVAIDGPYRYSLWREWDPQYSRLLWVLLNPSM